MVKHGWTGKCRLVGTKSRSEGPHGDGAEDRIESKVL